MLSARNHPPVNSAIVLSRHKSGEQHRAAPDVHGIIVSVPKLPKPFDVAVRHPRSKLLHNIELRYGDDFDVVPSSQHIPVN